MRVCEKLLVEAPLRLGEQGRADTEDPVGL